MATAWVGIGSNLGDRLDYIKKALGLMSGLRNTQLVSVSSVYDTLPVGRDDQPRFLNAVAELRTELDPGSLLNELLAIEGACGRIRRDKWDARTLDLDLLVYDDVRVSTEVLTLPHPRATERAFVLVPLAEIAPDLMIPGAAATVSELVRGLGDVESEVARVEGPLSQS